jgi:hypothetical protein
MVARAALLVVVLLFAAGTVCAQVADGGKQRKRPRKPKKRKPKVELVNPAQNAALRQKQLEDSIATTLVIAPDTAAKTVLPAGPQLTLEQATHVFGTVQQGQPVQHAFRFRNTGSAPLKLLEVTAACGCTATDWPRDPIPPGGSGEILVTFNTAGKLGPQMKHVFVRYNALAADPEEAEELGRAMLILQGEVKGLPGPPLVPEE